MEFNGLIIANNKYKNDFAYSFAINKWLLYISASWPLSPKTSITAFLLWRMVNFFQCAIMIIFITAYYSDIIHSDLLFEKKLKEE